MSQFQTVKSKRISSANNTTAIVVKANPGGVYGWNFFNNSAAKIFVKFYNATATVGTTTPILVVGINAATRCDVSLPYPMWFDTKINIGITTGIADNDTTAPAANDVIGQVLYL